MTEKNHAKPVAFPNHSTERQKITARTNAHMKTFSPSKVSTETQKRPAAILAAGLFQLFHVDLRRLI